MDALAVIEDSYFMSDTLLINAMSPAALFLQVLRPQINILHGLYFLK